MEEQNVSRRETDQFSSLSDHDILVQHSVILSGLQFNINDIKNTLDSTLKEKTDVTTFRWIVGGIFLALLFLAGITLDNRATISKLTIDVEVLKQIQLIKKKEIICMEKYDGLTQITRQSLGIP